MPRDGSGTYHAPFPDVAPDTTIASTVYNGFVNDVAQDLNAARPIGSGGTGGTSTASAMFNLKGESTDQVVTNYASQVFLPGSFYSSNATGQGAPVDGHAFCGIAYLNEPLASPPTNQNLVIELVDQTEPQPGTKWMRQKVAGVWSTWTSERVLYISDTPPPTAAANTLWWKSDTGILYVHYIDPDNTVPVWVMATPVPDTSIYLPKNGGTMTGTLTLNGNAVNPLDAVPKQQLDAAVAPLAPLASPALTGAPTAPTQAANDNSTKLATTQYADRAAANAVLPATGTGAFVHAESPTIHHIDTNNAAYTGVVNANILMYNFGGAFWSGIGADPSGGMHFTTANQDWYWEGNGGGTGLGSALMHLIGSGATVGNLYIAGVYSPSDARLKSNVQTLAPSPYFDELRPVTFNWTDTARGTDRVYGLIAQELQQLEPVLVMSGTTVGATPECPDPLTVNYTELIPELIAQVQSLKARVATLEGAA